MARNEKGPMISAQLLICPIISSEIKDDPYDNCVDQYFLTKDAMKFSWNVYLQSPEDHKRSYASPNLAASLEGLPPAVIITAEFDPLREEAEDYGNSLKNAGVSVITKCFSNVIHGFIDLPIYEESEEISWICKIKDYLGQLER